jgi:hypothetical protein
MMAAAQAAAEEALRAALSQEGRHSQRGASSSSMDGRQGSGSISQPHQGAGPAPARSSQSDIEQEHLRLMNEVMQATATAQPLLQDQAGGGAENDQQVALLQEIMGLQQQLDPNDPMTSQLLQLLAQQEQEVHHRQRAGVALPSRPEEHYLTIAQNGTFQ